MGRLDAYEESTADHYLSLGGIIKGLAPGDLAKALDYNKIVNTESRRDAVLVDVISALLRKPPATFDPSAVVTGLDAIVGDHDRDEALATVMARLSDEPRLSEAQLQGVIPIMAKLPESLIQ